MRPYKLIKTKGTCKCTKGIGYFVRRMYRLDFSLHELKQIGLRFVKERLNGWTIWWVETEDDYINAIKTLDELKKTHLFTYEVSE